ncbi:MAG: transglycosylase SLT domain-containing protein [Thermaceae bacterium]|nr:transglycosylase SLT domain-containing protein [Thermaceae bacterium]
MDWTQLARNPLLWLGVGGLLLLRRGSGGMNPSAPPTPTPKDGAGCGYPRTDLPPAPAKTNAELVDRTWGIILAGNSRVNDLAQSYGYEALPGQYAKDLAAALVAAAGSAGVPLDLLVAQARRESAFTPTVTTNRYLAIGWGDDAIRQAVQNGWAIGPLQVKPVVFDEVGLANPIRWPGDPVRWSSKSRLNDAVLAGARYLAKQKGRFGSWCAALHAYTVGPGAYQNGSRADSYVTQIISWANGYTELRT